MKREGVFHCFARDFDLTARRGHTRCYVLSRWNFLYSLLFTLCLFYLIQALLERHERRMHAQLQDGPDPASGFGLEFSERVEIPGIEHDGFFTDGIGIDAQREADMRVVQVIGRANADVIHAELVRSPAQFLEMAVEALELAEIAHIGEVAVEYPHGIVWIGHGHERIAGVLDGLEVAGCDVSGYAGEGKVLHLIDAGEALHWIDAKHGSG